MHHVFATRTPFLVPHAGSASRDLIDRAITDVSQLSREMRINSAFLVPILLHGEVIGTLGLSRHGAQADPLDEQDLSLLQTLAEQAALVIALARVIEESKRELAERKRMAARLNLLADASQAFSEATGDYDRLLAVIAGCLVEVLGDLCAISAVSEDGKVLEPGSVHHRDPKIVALAQRLLVAHPIPVGEGVSGGVAGSGEPLFVPCVSLSAFVASALPAYRELLERVNVGSLIIVPMLCRGKVVGVASSWRRTPRPSSPAPSSTSTVGTCSYERAQRAHAGAPAPAMGCGGAAPSKQ